MRKNPVALISLLSLMVLIIIQSYVIVNHYNAISKIFDMAYSKAILSTIESNTYFDSNDTLDIELERLAAASLISLPDTLNHAYQLQVLTKFDSLLNKYDHNSPKVKRYLIDNKLDTLFKSRYVVNGLSFLIDNNEIPVYLNPQNQKTQQKSKGLYIKSYYKEGDYYAVQYDYFVDLTHKPKLILSEMKGLLLLVILTITAVTLTFIYTLNTLWRQKKLSNLKDDFIDNITHEFKTPLSIISVAISSLKQQRIRDDSAKFADTCNTLEKQNKVLSRMIDHVIDVSLLDRNSVNYSRKAVSVKPFVNEIASSFKSGNEVLGKNVQIIEEYSVPDNFEYLLDPVQFTRALNNLLSNSVKYCEREPVIKVSVSLNDRFNISIKDNGIGIREEHKANVFSKFYRADNPARAKGLGLGLYIVKRIIENHGGTIILESIWGKGTTITITLPKLT